MDKKGEKDEEYKKEQEGEKGMNVALNYNLIGLVYSSQGDYSASLEMYQKSLKIYLSIFGESHPAVAANYNNIGYYYFSQGENSTIAVGVFDFNCQLENVVFVFTLNCTFIF